MPNLTIVAPTPAAKRLVILLGRLRRALQFVFLVAFADPVMCVGVPCQTSALPGVSVHLALAAVPVPDFLVLPELQVCGLT